MGSTSGSNRRGILLLGGAAALLVGAPRLWQALAPLPGAEPHPDVPGFYRLQASDVTRASDPFVGIGDPGPGIAAAQIADPCAALFAQPVPPGRVPVAYFTDINCPYCRAMEPRIAALPPERAAVTWHDLPLLGASSRVAARAILAAEEQGAAPALRARLHRTRFQPDPAYLRALAESVDLDADLLLADMNSERITRRIATSLGLAALFGIYGTPAVVIGATLAIGARSAAQLNAMLDVADRNGPCS